MLDSETKRRIDAARDILVGKIPDPKSQVEQITIALIYKFMDDMDRQSEQLPRGKATFFTKGYKKYAWHNILSPRNSGENIVILYDEALQKMDLNKNVPQLFRDIFKNAFLPYRDPETLRAFLKEINHFEYDHSERLGDAFEYLLSVLGSQGDAGQFRTPRHIIDFIVEVIQPKKNDKILDPACGTGGFLISAYKYIQKYNSKNYNPESGRRCRGEKLSSDERKRLAENIIGYDISPDMVMLSLANMYLHDFSNPHILEYDTLSHDDKWGEKADVILANPPFMSPKGGIRPHNKFSIKAKRSEVLFVDYIIEHLSIRGRAGIIVPEGIIFRNNKAYKVLRKKLVEDGLFAVVSLPNGVFEPYAGVKTSILLFDNQVAKKTDEMLFIKIENDGFSLSKQRREIDKDDLPEALEILKAWKKDKKQKSAIAFWAKKKKIAEDGDYNLTSGCYRKTRSMQHQKWSLVELKEICEIKRGVTITKKEAVDGDIPVIAGGQQPAYYHNKANREAPVITVSASGAYAGFVNFFDKPIYASDCSTIQPKNESKVNIQFVYRLLKSRQEQIYQLQRGGGQPHVYPKDLQKIKIPLPPLPVQKEIVEQIEVKQNAIDHAYKVIKNLERERQYFGKELAKLNGVAMVKLGELTEIARGGSPRPINKYITDEENGVNWIKIGDVAKGEKYITKTKQKIKPEGLVKTRQVKNGDFILSNSMSFGRPYIVKIDGAIHDGWLLIRINNNKQLIADYLHKILSSGLLQERYKKLATGGVVKNLNSEIVRNIKVPLPLLKVQKQLIAEAEKEEKIIAANKHLIEIMEQKIQKIISEV